MILNILWPILCFILVVLKVHGVIAITWFWALAPMWMPMCAGLAIIGMLFLFIGCIALLAITKDD